MKRGGLESLRSLVRFPALAIRTRVPLWLFLRCRSWFGNEDSIAKKKTPQTLNLSGSGCARTFFWGEQFTGIIGGYSFLRLPTDRSVDQVVCDMRNKEGEVQPILVKVTETNSL